MTTTTKRRRKPIPVALAMQPGFVYFPASDSAEGFRKRMRARADAAARARDADAAEATAKVAPLQRKVTA